MTKRLLITLALLIAAALPARSAAAEDVTTTVLGLLSKEGEISFAEELSDYLREAVEARESLDHTGKDQTLEQLAMAFGCLESLDPMCLQEIGEGLETHNLIYGRVELVGEDDEQAYKATITLFDVPDGKVVKTTAVQIPLDQQGTIYLQEGADRIVATLFGEKQRTTLIVQSNVGGATITLDGEEVGETGAEPLWLRDIEPGTHELEVRKDGYETYVEEFDLEPGGRIDIDAPMYKEGEAPAPAEGVTPVGEGPGPAKDTSKIKLWTGVGVGALGVALIATGGGMTAMVAQANDDLADARSITLSGQDVCSCFNNSTPTTECFGPRADSWNDVGVSQSKIQDACSRGKAGQVAQFVFYGLGAAAVGVGVGLVVSALVKKEKPSEDASIELGDDDEDEEEYDYDEEELEEELEEDEFEEAALQIMPSFVPGGGMITVGGRF
jgi:hypothetical protein